MGGVNRDTGIFFLGKSNCRRTVANRGDNLFYAKKGLYRADTEGGCHTPWQDMGAKWLLG